MVRAAIAHPAPALDPPLHSCTHTPTHTIPWDAHTIAIQCCSSAALNFGNKNSQAMEREAYGHEGRQKC
jgi:hypothetical protein